MKLQAAVTNYISLKRAQGLRFVAEDFVLKAFCKEVGDIPIMSVEPSAVLVFLNGRGPVTQTWAKKYHILNGLYRFSMVRSWVSVSPLPHNIPKPFAPAFVPYIYSHVELKHLLASIPAACPVRSVVDDLVFRALILLLYGAGLRLGEALAFSMEDIDLQRACLTVKETKFFKHRLVPMGVDLTNLMAGYALKRNNRHAATSTSPFICRRDGSRLSQSAARSAFRRLLAITKIHREGGARRQPRLHDLRHTAAVHRVVAWYRSGFDINEKLPKLATYLGHVDISSTQRYLTMTPDLLSEASLRFERYAMETQHD